jgi:hypothetical protein
VKDNGAIARFSLREAPGLERVPAFFFFRESPEKHLQIPEKLPNIELQIHF